MTTYENLVRETEKSIWDIFKDSTISDDQLINKIAELSVAMKAEGFDEGMVSALNYVSIDRNILKTNYNGIEHDKQSLGLKPTNNE